MKKLLGAFIALTAFAACKKDKNNMPDPDPAKLTFKIENISVAKPFVQSGTFKGEGTPPVILPGSKISFSFSAGKGQAISFATMYGWSNDLFFAPANPGIALYDGAGKPVEGDVSSQIKLWDNGSMVNQQPGMTNPHNGAVQNGVITEVKGKDAEGFSYLSADQLMRTTLKYNGNSIFTITLENISGGTTNATPFSPGVWTVSGFLGGKLLNENPLFTVGQKTANGLQPLAEMGNNQPLADYTKANTGITTGLSPALVVVYNGDTNPIFTGGENDRGNGLSSVAQEGDATALAAALKGMKGVKQVYVIEAPQTKAIVPGGSASAKIEIGPGDKLTFVSMFGSSNDWFYSFEDKGISYNALNGDLSSLIKLMDNGTEIDEYPGAGNNQPQFNPNQKAPEAQAIKEVGNKYPVLQAKDIIKVSITK
ncbi:spondin domain-containing protein [Pedobacter caeni]|uniref:Spondin_N n=1 Tax=Pedobacter caeni TaxID=288992 RepID=A0A1M5HXW2_9SPHI|nr:spondin domain-containing protein [Pedobacter caeni]SHG20693.1 hypothetical protein SAMN04488522_104865 [Pedobacter caeni]